VDALTMHKNVWKPYYTSPEMDLIAVVAKGVSAKPPIPHDLEGVMPFPTEEVYFDTHRVLNCAYPRCRKMNWCDHRADVVTNSYDAVRMGALPVEVVLAAQPNMVMVPIRPTADVHVAVELMSYNIEMGYRSVHVWGDQLGKLYPGEFLGSLRLMVWDLIYTQADAGNLYCDQKIHSSRALSKHDPIREEHLTSNDLLFEAIHILGNDHCLDCSGFTNFADDAPVL
jgi:hypothetical protein